MLSAARFRNTLRDEVTRQPVPDADFAGDVEKEEETDQKKQWTAEHRSYVCENEAAGARGSGHFDEGIPYQCDDGERCNCVGEANPIAPKKIRSDERCGESADAEEKVSHVQRSGAMQFTYVAD